MALGRGTYCSCITGTCKVIFLQDLPTAGQATQKIINGTSLINATARHRIKPTLPFLFFTRLFCIVAAVLSGRTWFTGLVCVCFVLSTSGWKKASSGKEWTETFAQRWGKPGHEWTYLTCICSLFRPARKLKDNLERCRITDITKHFKN